MTWFLKRCSAKINKVPWSFQIKHRSCHIVILKDKKKRRQKNKKVYILFKKIFELYYCPLIHKNQRVDGSSVKNAIRKL